MRQTVPNRPSRGVGTEEPARKPRQPSKPEEGRERDREHEGAREAEVGDRTGPAVGYDDEPEKTTDRGGVA